MLALVVSVAEAQAELAADALWSLGVVAVEERRAADGGIELWTSLGEDRSSVERALTAALTASSTAASPGATNADCTWRFVEIDETVADSWRLHAEPTWVADDLVIVPAWLPVPAPVRRRAANGTALVVSIEPGSTFGAGDHPTTVLSMRALRRLLQDRRADQPATVLDVGCGSGVLAIAAVMLGAHRADGIDISPAAVPVTIANAVANRVDERVSVSTVALADVPGTYDIVVANILAPALVAMADDLVRVTAAAGWLIISGLLADRLDHVVQALDPLRVVGVDELDGWAVITLQR